MKLLLALALLALVSAAIGQQEAKEPAPQMRTFYFVLLVRGSNQEATEAEELQKMQAGHLQTIFGLQAKRIIRLAGPFEVDTAVRGLAIMAVNSKEEVDEAFKDDPFVKSRRLELKAHKWFAQDIKMGQPTQPLELEKFTLVQLKKGKAWTAEATDETKSIQEGHMKNIQAMAESGDLFWAGPMAEEGDLRGLFLFRGADVEKLKKLMQNDPAIAKGRLVPEISVFYTPKGVVPAFKKG